MPNEQPSIKRSIKALQAFSSVQCAYCREPFIPKRTETVCSEACREESIKLDRALLDPAPWSSWFPELSGNEQC